MVPTIDGYKRAYGSVLCEVANPRKRGYVHSITLNIKFKIMNWRQEQQMLEDSFARALLIEYNIKEVTTQRQAKNGTRIFLCPGGQLLGSYESGYVRRCDSSDRIWQLNPKYKR